MVMGICLILVAVCACVLGVNQKEARALYYDAEEYIGFNVTVEQQEEQEKEQEVIAPKKPKTKVTPAPSDTVEIVDSGSVEDLKELAKAADPVKKRAQTIYDSAIGRL